MPCSARNANSIGRLVDNAQPIDASVNTASPPRITRLRPVASDSGPCTRLINAYANRYTLMVCCSATLSAPNCSPIWGNAGNMVSIENGPIMARPPRIRAKRAREGVTDGAGISSQRKKRHCMVRGHVDRVPLHDWRAIIRRHGGRSGPDTAGPLPKAQFARNRSGQIPPRVQHSGEIGRRQRQRRRRRGKIAGPLSRRFKLSGKRTEVRPCRKPASAHRLHAGGRERPSLWPEDTCP